MDTSAHNNIRNASNNSLAGPTDASVSFESCDYSGSGETDVVWDTANLSNGTRGRAWCEDFDNGKCDQFYAELDIAEINKGSNDEYDATKTACHELGHTVGLTHYPSGWRCMVSGEVPSTATAWRRYNADHRGHINDWF